MRKKELIEKRDRAIVTQFHLMYDVKRMRMDDVLKQLSEEQFYLDPEYIYSLVFYKKENNEFYNRLVDKHRQKASV
ncbi:MAG: hypothetical protein P4L28_00080 [Paludibacteraceae bacterium]|nr:hypothetical protein [Paludibacteraceae bacterium]